MLPEIPPLTLAQLPAFAPDLGREAPQITPLPDAPQSANGTADTAGLDFSAIVKALGAGSAQLEKAQDAENAFATGNGDLQTMVFERAKADSIVSVAAATTSRVAQAIGTLTQIQL